LVLVFIKILNQDNLDYFAVCYRPATCLNWRARHNKDNFIYAALPVEIGLAANRV
jgi:hypothetical protein